MDKDKDKVKTEEKKAEVKKPEIQKNPYSEGTAKHQVWKSFNK